MTRLNPICTTEQEPYFIRVKVLLWLSVVAALLSVLGSVGYDIDLEMNSDELDGRRHYAYV